jgi:low affinity Fe/Cu permease
LATGDQYRHHDRHVPDGVLIQNTQNRDTKALQVKLSELILALEAANNKIAAIENASPEELDAAQEEIQERAKEEAG